MKEARSLKDWLELEAVQVEVEHAGFRFTVHAFPERLTQSLFEQAQAAKGDRDAVLYKAIIQSWSLEEPFDDAAIKALSPGLKMAILDAVKAADSNPTQAVTS
jgi:hypothetical protein